ncbi:WXG100 family type VII secretion target [Streptosporangium subroseum]|uniref:WXG100 family type VII secretion target n=1 Tax=Streptosporangium subroseum TaxID=106412 RepID=A0A239HEY7_9ACTN|nr:WXG100 family type VII secretion target [Streptosporangium subroseum]SNS79383.1 WXG100 family type VII secretion target [Streptosporangium subroseum]
MAQQTQVKEHDLQEAINWIVDSAERIRTIQKNLDTAGAELQASWQGQSHQAFNKVHILWHQRIDVILKSLQDLAQNIQSSNKNYSAFTQEALAEISKIESLINAAPPAASGR